MFESPFNAMMSMYTNLFYLVGTLAVVCGAIRTVWAIACELEQGTWYSSAIGTIMAALVTFIFVPTLMTSFAPPTASLETPIAALDGATHAGVQLPGASRPPIDWSWFWMAMGWAWSGVKFGIGMVIGYSLCRYMPPFIVWFVSPLPRPIARWLGRPSLPRWKPRRYTPERLAWLQQVDAEVTKDDPTYQYIERAMAFVEQQVKTRPDISHPDNLSVKDES